VCGIAGAISYHVGSPGTGVLDAMTDILAHRGPDGRGVHVEEVRDAGIHIGLGHRRLAVIDLTSRGAQPMRSGCEPAGAAGAWIVCNGEIYNYVELREELETLVADGGLLLQILEQVGFQVWFRYQKYREEFALATVTLAVDETPVGTFVEIEGDEGGIAAAAVALGRRPEEYLRDSYRALFVRACEVRGVPATDMLFETE